MLDIPGEPVLQFSQRENAKEWIKELTQLMRN